jgi:hypothetical protein
VGASHLKLLPQFSVIAVIYALTYRLSGEVQKAVWAASQVHGAIFVHVVERDRVDLNAPGALDRVEAHAEIQPQRQRQAADLVLLSSTPSDIAALR